MFKYDYNEYKFQQKFIKRNNLHFLDDMDTFLKFLFREGGIKLVNNLIPINHIKAIESDFIYPMEINRKRKETKIPYIFSMDILLRSAGLTEINSGILISRSSKVEIFNEKSHSERIKELYNSYINNTIIQEINLIKGLSINWKNEKIVDSLINDFRYSLNSALSECLNNYWYSITELANIIPSKELLNNISTAKFGGMWLVYNDEEYNSHIIPLMIVSYILDTFLRHIGLVSIYLDDTNPLEELGINIRFPTMFEYKGL